jgi:hypothetical protein
MSLQIDNSAENNPAIARCCDAWRNAYHAAIAKDEEEDDARESAEGAYCWALPPLFGVRNIRAFIACVAHGSLTGIIDGADSSRLLYAAQVAYSTRRIRPAKQKTVRPSSRKAGSESGAAQSHLEPKNAALEPFLEPVHPAQVSPEQ